MADEIKLPEDVQKAEAIKWQPIAELATAISELYSSKHILEPINDNDGNAYEPGDIGNIGIISSKTTRSTDPHASVCVNNSEETGFVYLNADYTAPFRLDKLGASGELPKRALAFEFAYDPKKFEDYLFNGKLPVLTTQYLIYYELVTNSHSFTSIHVGLPSEALAKDLREVPNYDEFKVIENLIESRRDKVKKFWDNSNPYETKKTVAGELYMLIEDPVYKECGYIARLAFAGFNGNGNGNSFFKGTEKRPAPWVKGELTGSESSRFVKKDEDIWWSIESKQTIPITPKVVTLTGISWDREPESNPSVKGFMPETAGAEGYAPPPVGCCRQFTWPSIGKEGGGENSFYNPKTLSSYIQWADWRENFHNPLTEEDLVYAKSITVIDPKDIPAERFPCYLGKGASGDKVESYNYLSTDKSIEYRYQRWSKVADDLWVRLVPMEFEYSDTLKVYLTVPVTVVKILQPKSYQTAIRKRWYDMLYYSLRNIAGYKLIKYIGGYPRQRVIGVTWDRTKINDFGYMNPCYPNQANGTIDDTTCTCGSFSYERWKLLKLGGDYEQSNSELGSTAPFVDESNISQLFEYSNNDKEAAQTWFWEPSRLTEIKLGKLQNHINHDTLFPELYFERLLCYNNTKLYNASRGGFANPAYENNVCSCTVCKYEDANPTEDTCLILPWEGGGRNATCGEEDDSELISYNAHAYTFTRLRNMAEFIMYYKEEESKPRKITHLEIGYCYCPTTAGARGIQFNNLSVSYYSMDGSSCVTQTTSYELPAIPSYYNTLPENETYALSPLGNSCLLEVPKEVKPFGYSAYIWKAVDAGGYMEYSNDIKIKFIQYNPARVCSAGTIGPWELGPDATLDPPPDFEKKLYLHYSSITMSEGTPGPDYEGSIAAMQNNSSSYRLWKEILFDCASEVNSASSSIPIWDRGNAETAVGAIDVYVAPFASTSDKYDWQAKYIGSISIKRNPAIESDFNPSGEPTLENGYYAPGIYCSTPPKPIIKSMPGDIQPFIVNAVSPPDATHMLEVSVNTTNLTDKYVDGADNNWIEMDIVVPYELLLDDTELSNPVAIDTRQKYIIIATRSSHTKISSLLAYSAGVSRPYTDSLAPNAKHWVTYYSGGCRYAEFKTSYEFNTVKRDNTQ